MIAYFDLPSGLSGDIFLSCLVDAGWDIASLQRLVDSLNLGELCTVSASRVMRRGVSATHVDVQTPQSNKHRHLHHIEAIINGAALSQLTKDRAIAVDYFVEQRRPAAIQILRGKSDLSGTMEKWGFRWHELKNNYSGLAPVMLYDRDTQVIDPYSLHIGETECELFCGYDETGRIHDTLKSLG